jgi:hypothetical protein
VLGFSPVIVDTDGEKEGFCRKKKADLLWLVEKKNERISQSRAEDPLPGLIRGSRGDQRKRDSEAGPLPWLTRHGNRSSMHLDNPGDNGEPQPVISPLGGTAGRINLVEAFKQMREVLWRNPNARVPHNHLHLIWPRLHRQRNLSSSVGIAQRIL